MSNIYEMTDTWNDAGTVFTAIEMDVTDTASDAASLLMDLKVGGVSRFKTSKTGALTLNTADLADSATIFDFQENGASRFLGTARDGFTFSMGVSRFVNITRDGNSVVQIGNNAGIGRVVVGNGTYEWNPNTTISGVSDLILARDAANTLALRNGTNAQTFNIYNTYTDASNYERGFMRWASNVLEIGAEAAGTGTTRTLRLGSLATAGMEAELGGGTTAKVTIGARDGVYLQSRSVNRILLSEGGVGAAQFYAVNGSDVDLGLASTVGGGFFGLALKERTADPANPTEGQCVLWQSDGTGSGDDGDLMAKVTAGGVTSTNKVLLGNNLWNDAGTVFTAIEMDVTDTASDAASLLMDLKVGGTSKFSVTKAGAVKSDFFEYVDGGSYLTPSIRMAAETTTGFSYITTTNTGYIAGGIAVVRFGRTGATPTVLLKSDAQFGWGNADINGSFDLILNRDAANTLAQRNSTNAQTFNIYNTYTDASNYERGFLKWNSNAYEIGTEAAGTGSLRNLQVRIAGTRVASFSNSFVQFDQDFYPTQNIIMAAKYTEMSEMTAPSAPGANKVRIYAEDNGSGKTRLMALFPSGAAQQIAIEP